MTLLNRYNFRIVFITLFLLFSAEFAFGQEEGIYDTRTGRLYKNQNPPESSLFDFQGALKADIQTDKEKLFYNIEHPRKQDGVLVLYINDTTKIVKSIKIKVRGNTRKKICEIPPLKIDLNETDFLKEWLGKITSLKLVNACSPKEKSIEYLHREYLAYELYSTLTDISYRVKMLDLNLYDSKGRENPISGFAFVIENDKSLAARTGLKETEIDDTNTAEMINTFYLYPNEETLYHSTLLSVYQYMIGNSDWHITRLHNAKMFGDKEIQYIVPYDFDFSGIVNANYAKPSSHLPINKVTDRYYKGPCTDPMVVEKALMEILAKKDTMYKTINENPYIGKRVKQSMISYLNQFFKESRDMQEIVNKLSGFNCYNQG